MILLPEYCFHECLSIIPAAITAGGALLGAIVNNRMNQDNAAHAFNQEKDYSSWLLNNQTQAKVKDMRSAGLNPAFENGSQLGATPSSPSYNAPQVSMPDLSNAILAGAQYENMKANADNLKEDTETKRINNSYLPALKENEIALAGSQIDLNVSGANLNDAKAKEVAQAISESESRIAKMVGEMNIMRKQVDILTQEDKIKTIEASMKSEEMKAIIANLRASAKLSETQANDIVNTFAHRILNLDTQSNLQSAAKALVSWQSHSARLQFHLDKDYSEPERIVGIVQGATTALEGVGNTVMNFLPAGKAGKFAKTMKNVAPAKPNPVKGFGL